MARFLRELLFGSRISGRLRKKLKTQSDAVLLLLLEHRPTQRRVLVANCHLYWDPHFPHVKVAQAELRSLPASRRVYQKRSGLFFRADKQKVLAETVGKILEAEGKKK